MERAGLRTALATHLLAAIAASFLRVPLLGLAHEVVGWINAVD